MFRDTTCALLPAMQRATTATTTTAATLTTTVTMNQLPALTRAYLCSVPLRAERQASNCEQALTARRKGDDALIDALLLSHCKLRTCTAAVHGVTGIASCCSRPRCTCCVVLVCNAVSTTS